MTFPAGLREMNLGPRSDSADWRTAIRNYDYGPKAHTAKSATCFTCCRTWDNPITRRPFARYGR